MELRLDRLTKQFGTKIAVDRLRQAADAAKQGDHARAMELLRPVLNTEQAQALLRKLNG